MDVLRAQQVELVDDQGNVKGLIALKDGEPFLRLSVEKQRLELNPSSVRLWHEFGRKGLEGSCSAELSTGDNHARVELRRSDWEEGPTTVEIGVSDTSGDGWLGGVSPFDPTHPDQFPPRGVVIGATPLGATIRAEKAGMNFGGRGPGVDVSSIASEVSERFVLLHAGWARAAVILYVLLSALLYRTISGSDAPADYSGPASMLALTNCLLGLGLIVSMRRARNHKD